MTLTELCRLPDTTGGHSARLLLWSLWNHHYVVNLWNHIGNLDYGSRNEFSAIIMGTVEQRETAIRAIFTSAQEFTRIDTHPLSATA
jgi:hypothetical protein